MRKLIYTLAGAAALASASMAGAASVVTGSGQTLTPPDSGLFGAKITGGPTSFSDTFTFTIAGSAGSLNSQVSTLLLNGSQNINFTSILLDSTYAFTKTSTDPNPETWALVNPVLVGLGSHTITVAGNLLGPNGSYSGTLNVAAVPEPATWAMMLLGFGAMGLVIRRRRQPVLAQIA